MVITSGYISQLSIEQISAFLKEGSFSFTAGVLKFRCRSSIPSVAQSIRVLYLNHSFNIAPEFADFHVEICRPKNLRRWFRKQVEFGIDGDKPFQPLPFDQAPALFEWGLNWTIASSCYQWFTIHAAALERNGRVVILPAPPGSGKSTLCAALAFRGWRLLSDELTLLDVQSLHAYALARPINLKNNSIDVISSFVPDGIWSPEIYDTAKGRVTHLAPPKDSVVRMHETALPRWIVFPKYVAGAEPALSLRAKSHAFIDLAENSFNYSALGETGFDLIVRLLECCDCYDFVYSRLEDAVDVFDWLLKSVTDEISH